LVRRTEPSGRNLQNKLNMILVNEYIYTRDGISGVGINGLTSKSYNVGIMLPRKELTLDK